MTRAIYSTSWLAIVSLLLNLSLSAQTEARASWPNGPLVTSGRWITDATGAKITYVGANWPGSLEAMIPEGLQYQSIQAIVSKIKSLGMNAIRLTYATEMIDQYYDNGEQDVTMQNAFVAALGQGDGTAIYDNVVANNPSFGPKTTRLQVRGSRAAAQCQSWLLKYPEIRYMMPSLPSALNKRFMSTSTIIYRRQAGVAARLMATLGGATNISMLETGRVGCPLWPIMSAQTHSFARHHC